MLSKRSSSIRVAPDEWTAKLIPSGFTVGPSGSGSPGSRFVIFGMGSHRGGNHVFGADNGPAANRVPWAWAVGRPTLVTVERSRIRNEYDHPDSYHITRGGA